MCSGHGRTGAEGCEGKEERLVRQSKAHIVEEVVVVVVVLV